MPKLAIMALLALAGCGNAYESVSVGDWRQTGSAETPTTDISPLRGEVVVTRLAAGRGEKIKAGDMVQIRIGAKEGRFEGWSTYDRASASQAHVIWLWVGREPPWISYKDFLNWGHPGSARLRKALIGGEVGDRLEARLAPGAEGLIVLPLRGLGASL